MTQRAHEHPSSTDDWQLTLRSKGYRLTPQRELVLRAVERLGHATPDEVLTAVREESQAVNVSTVYRTLELLEDLGLVRHAHITDRARDLLGWSAELTVADGVESALRWAERRREVLGYA